MEASFIDDDTICYISADGNWLYTCQTVSIPSGECQESFTALPRMEDGAKNSIVYSAEIFPQFAEFVLKIWCLAA